MSEAAISMRLWRVWQRNLTVYRKTWKVSFLPPLLEPIFYLAAFGAGMGRLVGEVHYAGAAVRYVDFLAPALLSVTVLYNAFFENTYNSFVRMFYQRTYDAMLATPLTLPEILLGEILWGATKALIAAALMQALLTLLGLVSYPTGLLLPLYAVIGGLAFASLGMLFTAIVPGIETFNLPIFLFITPMFLFSGTFFPLDGLPTWAQRLAQALPLTWLVQAMRGAALGRPDPHAWAGLGLLLAMALLLTPIAIRRMQRRLLP